MKAGLKLSPEARLIRRHNKPMQKRLLIAATAAFLSLPLAITAAEEKKKGGGFGALDTNKDGQLTLAEFTAGQKNKDGAEARFKALDTDKNGTVSAQEFSAGQKKKGEGKKKNQ